MVESWSDGTFSIRVEPDAMTDAVWALVLGLAFLYLDGKFDATAPEVVAARTRAAVHAALEAAGPARKPPQHPERTVT
ncbi:hypothetical protein ACWCPQ_20445 [Nocardia sp. NPDC001965]